MLGAKSRRPFVSNAPFGGMVRALRELRLGSRTQRLHELLVGGETVDVRGYGKAGGGLVLVMQAFARMLTTRSHLVVQDWPLFSSARKGATVCAYMRIGSDNIEIASQVTEPDIAILMNEAAAEEVDFAEGADDALFVINTEAAPREAASRYRLGGTVVTVAGDELGRHYLNRPLANMAVLAALVRATDLIDPSSARDSLTETLRKRRLPERIIAANQSLFDAALEKVRIAEVPASPQTAHVRKPFRGYGLLPAGAQSALRTSTQNRTAGYGRPGVKIEFVDPASKCNACSLCVVQCPEGIIDFVADPARGALVHGARFDQYCKVCRECVTACPLDLFREVAAVVPGDGALAES